MNIKDKTFELFIKEETIRKRVKELATQVSFEYKDKDPLFIPILNGAFLFAAELIKEVTIPCQLSFVKVSSYSGTESTGAIKQLFGLDETLENRNLIIVDDIIDTGLTMYTVVEQIKKMNPASIEVMTFLLKPEAVKKHLQVKYVGFPIPNSFVVGYGLDYDGYGRNLKDVYRLESGS
jgi:hypoxanthine phosphoribosyltransferase